MDSNKAVKQLKEERSVHISTGPATLEGNLVLPQEAKGVVLFAHGSGSSRFSPRNRYVAKLFQESGLATLLIDLLTEEEERLDSTTYQFRFDIDLLADRLSAATYWLKHDPDTKELHLGYFGASTGAAAALIAASLHPDMVNAVVSRGGRPDLAGAALAKVKAPTLLIVGGEDYTVIKLNRDAAAKLQATKELVIVEGATHLFEEPGALEKVADLAKEWFIQYLAVS